MRLVGSSGRMFQRFLPVVALLLAGPVDSRAQVFKYPEARTQELVEDYHGTSVAAPYRWLEADDSEETRVWTEAQNRLTREYLDRTGRVDRLRSRLTAIRDYPRYSSPVKWGNRYFYSGNDGLQNQSVLYVQESLHGKARVLLDPNKLSEDGTTALTGGEVSRDGRYLAYGLSLHGSDEQEYFVRDVDTGKDLDDRIQWCKFSSFSWVPDGSGFYYSRFPEPGTVSPEDENNFNRVYWHVLGTSQSEDRMIFGRDDAPELGFSPYVTEDGKYLVLTVYHGTDPRYGLYYVELLESGLPAGEDFTRLFEPGDAMYAFVENVKTRFYVHTDKDAPRGRILAVDIVDPSPERIIEVVPERPDLVIETVVMGGDRLVVSSMKDACNRLQVFGLDGTACPDILLPELGSVVGLSARIGDPELFYTFASFLSPAHIFRHDLSTGKTEDFRSPALSFPVREFETRQVFFESQDGTRVPMFLTHRKGLRPDGQTPVLLYGYGGFNINLTPYFKEDRLLFLEAGGIYAVVNLRGGSEYGEEWHQAGMLGDKQNVFDDFIAAAEYLIAEGFTVPDRIAIMGGSNGGLLVCACMLQRPELYRAVVAAVPVTDMLRYHRFTVGRYWVPEYGSADSPEHFAFLYAYSPLHNIKPGVDYPGILVTTADTDDRVVPGHSRKFVAALQAAGGKANPFLIRLETRAGHGKGKPISKQIDEAADIYAFMFERLGMDLPSPAGPSKIEEVR